MLPQQLRLGRLLRSDVEIPVVIDILAAAMSRKRGVDLAQL